MTKHENSLPADRYSRNVFETGMNELDASGIPYAPKSVERNADPDWQLFYEAATDKERTIINNLDRIYAIAMSKALGEKSKRELEEKAKQVIPQLKEAEHDVRETVARVGEGAPDLVSSGHDLLDMIEEVIRFFMAPTTIEQMHELVGGVPEAYARFKKRAFEVSSPGRYQKI